MGLMCGCDDEPPTEPGAWWYYIPNDFTEYKGFKRRRRCRSCQRLIEIGEQALEFERERNAREGVEWEIYHENPIDIPSHWFCGDCGEIYLNLTDAGYCLGPQDNMAECLAEYHAITGFEKKAPRRGAQAAAVGGGPICHGE